MPPVLSVTVADRPEELIDLLVDGLRAPLHGPDGTVDPFAPDWVTVANHGFRNWVQQQLAVRLGAPTGAGDGVVANTTMSMPGALRWRVLNAFRSAGADGAVEEVDPWQVERLTWTVLGLIVAGGDGVDARLGKPPEGGTLSARAAAIAELFDRYSVHRPSMVLSWIAGDAVGADGSPLGDEQRWQFDLFRAVRARIGEHHAGVTSPAERLRDAVADLRSGELRMTEPGPHQLPSRLFAVGLSAMSSELGPLLDALAVNHSVSMLLVSPSSAASVQVAARTAAAAVAIPARDISWSFPRPVDVDEHANPLVDTWAQRPLDSARMLGAAGIDMERVPAPDVSAPTLLASLQQHIRADVAFDGGVTPASDDRSFQVHAAPGPTRQVEVLRDAILGLLRDDPTLVESDVLVVCPQLEAYAPVIGAVLGPSAERGSGLEPDRVPSLRYTIVNQRARSFNPVFEAMAQILSLVTGRFEVSAVREVLGLPAVRERFGLTSDDLGLVHDLADRGGVRWGLDGPHRAQWNIDVSHEANSWSAGVDQLMMGLALGDDLRTAAVPDEHADVVSADDFRLALGGVAALPLDDGALAGAGRVAAAVRSLARAHELLVAGPQRPIAAWCTDLATVADLLVAPAWGEDWQRTNLDGAFRSLESASEIEPGEPSPLELSFSEVRRLLSPAFEGSASRSDLGFGSVVVAPAMPVANVPARVVCILGLDAEALPVGRTSGDDLLAQSLAIGDRDRRADVRADLLAAVTSAREHLLITCTSRNVRTNVAVPQAVVLEELLDAVGALTGRAREELANGPSPVICDHPRQSFAEANFTSDSDRQPFGFDPVALEGARTLRQSSGTIAGVAGPQTLVESPLALAADEDTPVDLDDLRRFYRHPVRHFLNRRLNVVVPRKRSGTDDGLPVSLDGRDRSAIGSAIYRAVLAGGGTEALAAGDLSGLPDEVGELLDSFRARGAFPPDSILDPSLEELTAEVSELLGRADELGVRAASDEHHLVETQLASGERLIGMVTDCIGGQHPGPMEVSLSKGSARSRLGLAIDLLALTVHDPGVDWRSVYLARPEGTSKKFVVEARRVRGDSPDERHASADRALQILIGQYRDGQRLALPLFSATSRVVFTGTSSAAAKVWETSPFSPVDGEDIDPYHVRAFGELTFIELDGLDVDGFTLRTEARRLWGTLDEVLIDGALDREAGS